MPLRARVPSRPPPPASRRTTAPAPRTCVHALRVTHHDSDRVRASQVQAIRRRRGGILVSSHRCVMLCALRRRESDHDCRRRGRATTNRSACVAFGRRAGGCCGGAMEPVFERHMCAGILVSSHRSVMLCALRSREQDHDCRRRRHAISHCSASSAFGRRACSGGGGAMEPRVQWHARGQCALFDRA
jgi:hypothetical protein